VTDTSQQLFSEFREGSEDAADRIFARYVQRLTALARLRLSERLARRIDAEDIVLSAYRSFFIAARDGRFVLNRGGDLWRLLVSITLHKLHRQVAAHRTLKRSMNEEVRLDANELIPSRDPTPEEVLLASEELEAVLVVLPPLARRVLELRLQGESLASIANETKRTERTVRRMLELARTAFQRRLVINIDREDDQ
jgi:RNA polymerase sigma factor (sigma-70 family)